MDDPDDDEFDERGTVDRLRAFVRDKGLYLAIGLVGVLALVASGISAFALTEGRRDTLRIATDIAQLRVSLDLFSRQIQGAGPGGQSLVDLSNRLVILEQAWRDQGRGAVVAPAAPGAPGAAGVPAAPPQDGVGVADSTREECIPSGTRFLAMQNDSYPVCGTDAKVALMAIGNGNVVLEGGTSITTGSSGALTGTRCMVGVLSAETDGVTGFAELRITC